MLNFSPSEVSGSLPNQDTVDLPLVGPQYDNIQSILGTIGFSGLQWYGFFDFITGWMLSAGKRITCFRQLMLEYLAAFIKIDWSN